MKMNIGISEEHRKGVAEGLCRLLADNSVLYLKTHNFHWNVTGPQFTQLHASFEDQYTELWQAGDLIAERIRAIGHYAPGSYVAYQALSSIKESVEVPSANDMIAQLLEGHEAVARTARSIYGVAQAAGDEATLDLLTQRLQVHEKTAWMLRSLLA